MSRSIRKETSSFAFGMVGRFGGGSAGFVVAALNAASAASREVVVLRVLSAGILCPLARLHFLKPGGQTKRRQKRPLFDHLVGAGEQRRRHVEAERPGGLEVYVQPEFCCLLHREVGSTERAICQPQRRVSRVRRSIDR